MILAAGASSRLGEPKQLAMLAGERLLERAVRVAKEAGCAPVVVVLGASAGRIEAECQLDAAKVIVNAAWASGMASSIRAGIASLDADGTILMTCDQPAVTAEHLRRLMGADEPVSSSYSGRRGVPAYFPRRWFCALLMLEGDAGARSLLQAAPTVELARGEFDVDTQEALEAARSEFG